MIVILLLILLIPLFIYYYIYKPHQHWKNLNVPYVEPFPLLGNLDAVIFQKKGFHEWVQDLYNAKSSKIVGMYSFNTPVFLIRDLDLIKKIGIKEFDHFVDHRPIISEDIDPLFGKNLFTLRGEKWRTMRSTLSPAFTSRKMRSMFMLISDSAKQFTNHFLNISDSNKPTEIELKDTYTRFANDVIATTAFGIQCNSLEDKENEFYLMGKDVTRSDGIQAVKFFLYQFSERLMKWLKIQIISKKAQKFFRNIIKTTIEVRAREGIVRPDMIHLLMEARKGQLKHEELKDDDAGFATVDESEVGKDGRRAKIDLSDDDVTAQALLFFMAGFDTISTALCFISYELALNSNIQKRLQQEIDDTLEMHKGNLTYEVLMKMKYLDMVLSETLRKWPPVSASDRICNEDLTISAEDAGGQEVQIQKNVATWIPIAGIHHDPQYYPDPDKFNPERFSDENKDKIVPMSFLPFGVGPRNCIGSRFALMEAKTIIVNILLKFNFVRTEKTEVPLILSTGDFNLKGKNGIWVGLQKRNAN